MPERLTVWRLVAVLSVTVSVPVTAPSATGVNETEMEQLAPGAREMPQPLDWENAPVTEMPAMATVPVPVFLSVTVCGALVDPVFCAAKERVAGASVAL